MKYESGMCDRSFIQEIEKISGQKVAECYQCGKCSAGCPVGYAMDMLPDKVIRMVQLGMKDDVLSLGTPWLCAACETCSTRCPQEVELSRIMEAVRAVAVREKRVAAGGKTARFYSIFTDNVRRFGRVFEPMMMAKYNMLAREPFKDMRNAGVLFRKGKIAIRPSAPGNVAEIRQIFERAKSEEP